jgi:hypothetical protein
MKKEFFQASKNLSQRTWFAIGSVQSCEIHVKMVLDFALTSNWSAMLCAVMQLRLKILLFFLLSLTLVCLGGSLPKKTVPFSRPVPSWSVPVLCVCSLTVGFVFFAWFLTYEMTTTSSIEIGAEKKNLFKELFLALTASTFLGFGSIFLLLWTGVYI